MVGALVVVKLVVGSSVVVGTDFVTGVLSELDSGNSFGTLNFALVAIKTVKNFIIDSLQYVLFVRN